MSAWNDLCRIPCIGFVSFAKLNNKKDQEDLKKQLFKPSEVPKTNLLSTHDDSHRPEYLYDPSVYDKDKACLDDNHNYFIMVEPETKEKKGEWVDQLEFWSETEDSIGGGLVIDYRMSGKPNCI